MPNTEKESNIIIIIIIAKATTVLSFHLLCLVAEVNMVAPQGTLVLRASFWCVAPEGIVGS